MAKNTVLKSRLETTDKISKRVEFFYKTTRKEIDVIGYDNIKDVLYTVNDLVCSCVSIISQEKAAGKKSSKTITANNKMIKETFQEYEKFKKTTIDSVPEEDAAAIKKRNKKSRLPSGVSFIPEVEKVKKEFKKADSIIDKLKAFSTNDSKLNSYIQKNIRETKKSKLGKGLAVGLSAITGSALPIVLQEGLGEMKGKAKQFAKASASGKMKMMGKGLLSGAGVLAGSPGLMMLGSHLGQNSNAEAQERENLKKQIKDHKRALNSFGREQQRFSSRSSSSRVAGSSLTRKDFDAIFAEGVRRGIFSKFHVGGVVKGSGEVPAMLMGGERVLTGEQSKIFTEVAKSTKGIDASLKKLLQSNDKIAYIAEETLEDQRDAALRSELLRKKQLGISNTAKPNAPLLSKEKINTSESSPITDGITEAITEKITESVLTSSSRILPSIVRALPVAALVAANVGIWKTVYDSAKDVSQGGTGDNFINKAFEKYVKQPMFGDNPYAGTELDDPTPVAVPTSSKPFSYSGLGSVSAFSESGGNAGTISTGAGDAGGKSYGSHQLSSNKGQVDSFLKSSGYGSQFQGLKVGSTEFDAKWKQLAASDQGFGAAQEKYVASTHAAPQLTMLQGMGIDTNNKAIQEMAFSTGVQYGPNSTVIQDALMKSGKDPKSLTPKEIIEIVQDYKARTVRQWFKKSSRSVQQSVAQRHSGPEKQALLNLATENGAATPNSPALAVANVTSPSVGPATTAVSKRMPQEGSVGNIANNSQALSHIADVTKLKKVEAATDAAALANISKGTKEAINNINIGGTTQAPAVTNVVYTGDMNTYAIQLARSY